MIDTELSKHKGHAEGSAPAQGIGNLLGIAIPMPPKRVLRAVACACYLSSLPGVHTV
jgi:hypothetical protein